MNHTKFVQRAGRRDRQSKEEFWRGLVRECATSGQSIRAFCAAHRVSEPTFYAWRRALGRPDSARRQGAAPPDSAFLPVRLTGAIASRIEIALPSGHRIRLSGPVDRLALAEVLSVLRGPNGQEA